MRYAAHFNLRNEEEDLAMGNVVGEESCLKDRECLLCASDCELVCIAHNRCSSSMFYVSHTIYGGNYSGTSWNTQKEL